jgi:beta-lactamase superfamily II metal-dependent hydrolase
MATRRRLAIDLATVRDEKGRVLTTFAWGDVVDVVAEHEDRLEVRFRRFEESSDGTALEDVTGYIEAPSRASRMTLSDVLSTDVSDPSARVLRVDFVDVQQGDGAVIETPKGKVVLVDGGDNQLFARYLAARFPGTTAKKRKKIDAIIVTHGDADHFQGLAKIHDSEDHDNPRKRLFISPARIYHNGIVKRPSKSAGRSVPDKELLGPTAKTGDGLLLTGLVDDLREVDEAEMNVPFQKWLDALRAWSEHGDVEMRRLARGSDDAFDFLDHEGIKVEVLGPIPTEHRGKHALRFLGTPVPKIARQPGKATSKGFSASHTINGHSVILRITYRGVRFFLAGDLNEEAEELLTRAHEDAGDPLSLESEVLKVPHHGSADFAGGFLKAVAPVVSVISSGDESEKKEYIHPRASLVGALGRYARGGVEDPLVFCTELAAFFKVEGWVKPDASGPDHRTQRSKRTKEFFAFTRKSFGMVKVRTDGERLLVYTYSGKDDMKEAYAFRVIGGTVESTAIRSC